MRLHAVQCFTPDCVCVCMCVCVSTGSWRARTCGRVPWDSSLHCVRDNGADGCPCVGPLCNAAGAAPRDSPTAAATITGVLLTAALSLQQR